MGESDTGSEPVKEGVGKGACGTTAWCSLHDGMLRRRSGSGGWVERKLTFARKGRAVEAVRREAGKK